MDLADPQVFIQGGAVGLALALIFLLALVLRFTYKMMASHNESSNEIIMENARAMTKLAGVIETNTNAITMNTRVTERVERFLDNR
jgi:hypothetical protein